MLLINLTLLIRYFPPSRAATSALSAGKESRHQQQTHHPAPYVMATLEVRRLELTSAQLHAVHCLLAFAHLVRCICDSAM
ncbi:hypothetical protein VTK56DRAFT_4442 [Thermocarpiscus australiensis]